jgi:hypothetical protein
MRVTKIVIGFTYQLIRATLKELMHFPRYLRAFNWLLTEILNEPRIDNCMLYIITDNK